MKIRNFIPADYIDQCIAMSREIFGEKEEMEFLKSCLFYLKEGMNAEQAIELSMVDYLVDM